MARREDAAREITQRNHPEKSPREIIQRNFGEILEKFCGLRVAGCGLTRKGVFLQNPQQPSLNGESIKKSRYCPSNEQAIAASISSQRILIHNYSDFRKL